MCPKFLIFIYVIMTLPRPKGRFAGRPKNKKGWKKNGHNDNGHNLRPKIDT